MAANWQGQAVVVVLLRRGSNRIIIFCTKRCLKYLANSSVWYGDGTFSVACYSPCLWSVYQCTLDGEPQRSHYYMLVSDQPGVHRNRKLSP